MPRIYGGLLSCWPQSARRRGSFQKKKKKICKNGLICWRKMKKEGERKEDGRNA